LRHRGFFRDSKDAGMLKKENFSFFAETV